MEEEGPRAVLRSLLRPTVELDIIHVLAEHELDPVLAAFNIGGTLSVGADQPTGSYLGTFEVTVFHLQAGKFQRAEEVAQDWFSHDKSGEAILFRARARALGRPGRVVQLQGRPAGHSSRRRITNARWASSARVRS